jgi:tRNA G18 (ribose-2'-O)-methylase SpoU
MAGGTESLNAAVAGSLLAFAALYQRLGTFEEG